MGFHLFQPKLQELFAATHQTNVKEQQRQSKKPDEDTEKQDGKESDKIKDKLSHKQSLMGASASRKMTTSSSSSSSSSGSLMKNDEKQIATNKNTLTIGKAFTQHGRINKTKHHRFH